MHQKKVLIVEDDAVISGFIEKKLQEMGCEIVGIAINANDAIAMAQEHRPQVILMDVILEGEGDGIYAVEQITKTLDVPVVYLTSSTDEQSISRLMKTDPNGFILKPFDERILFSAIQVAVYRHKTRKELFSTKELLRTTIESIDDLVFSLDQNGLFTHNLSGDKHALDYFQPEKILGKTVSEVFPSDVALTLKKSIQWSKDFKKPSFCDFKIEKNGQQFWFNAQITLRKDEQGNILGFTLVISDVTESKNMYQELLVSQEKLSEAQNIARLGSCDVFFKESKIVYNDLFFTILGVKDRESLQHFDEEKFIMLIHPEDRSRYKLLKKQILEDHKTGFTTDHRIVDPQGNVKHIHAIGQIKYDQNNEPERMIMTIQDVTWQKTNEKLRHDVELAKKTTEVKQKFFARLSHEIRNPISGITGLLHLLENTELDDKQKEYIQALKISSDTLMNLLGNVLDFTRIESGMMKVKHVDFALPALAKNLYTFFTPRALEKNITFRYSVQEDMPNRIITDENKLIQILSNLLSNAFKFTHEGVVEFRVKYKDYRNQNLTLRVEVDDTGIGIDPSGMDKLFKDFSQIDNQAVLAEKGSGLGLAICKQLVELLNGTIGVENKNEKGALFWFEIPAMVDMEEKQEITEVPKEQPVSREKLNCSVLLVEDMAINQKVLRLMLEEMGCKVTIASNGQEAIELYRETAVNAFDIFAKIHYDIILMDHIMPVMDGVTALKKLKKDYQDLPPVIILTADESFAQNNEYQEKGFDDCLIKPVSLEELYQKCKEHLQKRAPLAPKEKLELFTIADVDKKPVVNTNTLDLIVSHARQNNFNIDLLFESFIDDMERIYEQTLSAIEVNDYNALKLIVMTIKGLSGNIGASQVHATAKLMDRYIRNEQYEEAVSLFPVLTEKYSIFKNTIESDYMKSLAQQKP